MIITGLIVVYTLSCAPTIIENRTKIWNEQDQKTLESARIRCGQIYDGAPCVKLFRKKDDTTYNVICGSERK